MSSKLIREYRKEWLDVIRKIANENEEVDAIVKDFMISFRDFCGKPTGLGYDGALEFIACLGVFLSENNKAY